MLNQAPSLTPVNPAAITHAQQQAAQPSAPAQPSGSYPVAPTQPMPNAAPSPAAAASPATDENLLAQYAIKPDNDSQQTPAASVAPQPEKPAANPLAVPEASNYSQLAGRLAANIQIDPELQTAAMGGDVESFGQLLNQFGAQLLQASLHGAAASASHYTKQGMELARTDVTASVEQSQAARTAEASAISEIPALAEGLNHQILSTTLESLKKEYPTAPPELLGKEAARRLKGLAPQEAADSKQEEAVNWTEELSVGVPLSTQY